MSITMTYFPFLRYYPESILGVKSEAMPPLCCVCPRVSNLVGRSRDRSTIGIGHSSNAAGHQFRRDHLLKMWPLACSNSCMLVLQSYPFAISSASLHLQTWRQDILERISVLYLSRMQTIALRKPWAKIPKRDLRTTMHPAGTPRRGT